MTMALIPLACLPELRLTNRGWWTAPPSNSSTWWWTKANRATRHYATEAGSLVGARPR